MTWESFLKGMKTINVAMGRKMTAEDAELAWDLLSFIPESAWEPVTKQCIDRWEQYPRNLILAIKEQWYSYQADHHAQDDREKEECLHCHDSSGLIFIESLELNEMNYYTKAVVRCGHCRNWVGSISEKTKRLKRDEIRDKDYRVTY